MDELILSGKRYISTRSAGREHGYHSDYIGQLIRSGKVHGQKVGRAWYVETSSLNAYLGGDDASSEKIESNTPTEPLNDKTRAVPEDKNTDKEKRADDVLKQIKKEEEKKIITSDKQETARTHIHIRGADSSGLKYLPNGESYVSNDPVLNYKKDGSDETEPARRVIKNTNERPPVKRIIFKTLSLIFILLMSVVISTGVSYLVTATITIERGQAANAGYSIGY
jgi:hypothetical protein